MDFPEALTFDDVLLIPAGEPHSYETIGDEAYSFLCLVPKGEDCITIMEE